MKLHCLSYDIEIKSGLLSELPTYLASFKERIAIITDENVAKLYTLPGDYLFTFPHGEQNKTRETKQRLEDQLLEKGLGRDTCIIALGGGVVTDLAGFIAATYCRGVPLVMIPTTLLGMVDASIGGKTGVNVPQGKNLIGCIYQPKKVCIDPATLKSLPLNELSNGVVEMIKHGLIADAQIFAYLENHAKQLLALDPAVLEQAIFDSCRIKKEIVEEDEREKGKRHLLNFGHTVGHALERLTNYALPHGEAVAIGLLAESHMAVQLGYLAESDLERIRRVLQAYAVPLKMPKVAPEALLKAMASDKKALKAKPRFVLIEAIGSPMPFGGNYCTEVEEGVIKKALHWMNEAFHLSRSE